ncbi:ABC transporter permease [Aerococcus christensenii]|nr:FtsX-like permease family protein [Aerococcus christensenii]MDK8233626.1 FtsX-like permease family protein [Aerococcus christensenii]PKY91943.1 ABC transporter permease [Aerococcus christensenii]
MKKTLLKNARREIIKTWPRFLALLGIILLGIGFFVGIRAAAPDMLISAHRYYQTHHLQDLSVQSTFGLRQADRERIERVEGIDYLPYKTVDRQSEGTELLFHIFPDFEQMPGNFNKWWIKEGRLPQKEGEIAVDAKVVKEYGSTFQIGQKLSFNQMGVKDDPKAPQLKEDQFVIVGILYSPLYMDRLERGYTQIGNGHLNAFAVVYPEDLVGEYDSAFAIRVQAAQGEKAYSESYKEKIKASQSQLEEAFKDRGPEVLKETKRQAQEPLDQAKQTICQAKEQLRQKEAFLSAAQEQLAIQGQEDTLKAALKEKDKAKEALNRQEAQIDEKEKQLQTLSEPKYFINDRSHLPGVKEYGQNADRIAAIAQVFPWLFFLVAILVSYTTMTRMVDEKRLQVGTLKALGYSQVDIAMEFFIYASTATCFGALVGGSIGNFLFPWIICKSYAMMYPLPEIVYGVYWKDVFLSLAIGLGTTIGPVFVTIHSLLLEKTAELMRPKAPKVGGHIWIEKCRFLWNKLSFLNKITLRNLFRYKGRNLMMVLGVMGCTALVITGLGIGDSISGLAYRQFNVVESYDGLVQYASDLQAEDVDQVNTFIHQTKNVADVLPLRIETWHTPAGQIAQQNVQLKVLDASSNYRDYYALSDSNNQSPLNLPKDGVLVTQKLAKLFDLKVGDELPLMNDKEEVVNLPIKGIVEAYIGHSCIMSKDYYQEKLGKEALANSAVIQLKQLEAFNQVAETLKSDNRIVGVGNTQTFQKAFKDTLEALNTVTLILIVAAAVLDFIVLYSLTNINVSERLLELSTIKVLGAFSHEMTLYIFKELLIMTGIGIMLGLCGGLRLTVYILETVEIDTMIFPHRIHGISYLIATVLTFTFTEIVIGIMHIKLKQIDMVEALKGVE